MANQVLNNMAEAYCTHLKSFVTSLHTNCAQLKASIAQKPPAYCDLSSLLLELNDRVTESSAQMDLLEEMTIENVSFDELIAHSMELYKQNEANIALLETELEKYGYAKPGESSAVADEKESLEATFVEGLKQRVRAKELSPPGSVEVKDDNRLSIQNGEHVSSSSLSGRSFLQFETIRQPFSFGLAQLQLGSTPSPLPSAVAHTKLDSDDISKLGEIFSLEDFGISASSLASLVRHDSDMPEKLDRVSEQQQANSVAAGSDKGSDMDESCGSSPANSPTYRGIDQTTGAKRHVSLPLLGVVSKEEYSQVRPWLKERVALEELNKIVVEINDAFHIKQSTIVGGAGLDRKAVLELEESFLLGLGANMKSCLFILVQLDRLVMACRNGRTLYRPSELTKFR